MTINEWLESPEKDYATGVALYAKHGKNTNLLRLFQTREKEYTREKLEYELGKIAETRPEVAAGEASPKIAEGDLGVSPVVAFLNRLDGHPEPVPDVPLVEGDMGFVASYAANPDDGESTPDAPPAFEPGEEDGDGPDAEKKSPSEE
ncbi:MAG: hypothetical protein ACK4Q5_06080 [Saprospiraceae bacterium]